MYGMRLLRLRLSLLLLLLLLHCCYKGLYLHIA